MGQVPEKNKKRPYLTVGNGRLAKHFLHYFGLLKIPHWHWWRGSPHSFHTLFQQSDKILVLISDSAIENFITEHRISLKNDPIWIHCSGLISTPLAESAHPLMTFSDTMFESDVYAKIPFITEQERRPFPELFPELSNPHYSIPSQLKPLYHAWCVMSGNFTTLLWEQFFGIFKEKLGIPSKVAFPYLEQIVYNLIHSSSPLTGPLVRGDTETIKKHLDALKTDPHQQQVYRAFVQSYQSLKDSNSEKS